MGLLFWPLGPQGFQKVSNLHPWGSESRKVSNLDLNTSLVLDRQSSQVAVKRRQKAGPPTDVSDIIPTTATVKFDDQKNGKKVGDKKGGKRQQALGVV